MQLSNRHSLQIDARALLPGTRPPKPQVAEASAALTEEGGLEISDAAPALDDDAQKASKQRIAIKPRRTAPARAKSMMVPKSAISDDGWGEEEEEQQEEQQEVQQESAVQESGVEEAVEAAPVSVVDDSNAVAEAEKLAFDFPVVSVASPGLSASSLAPKQQPLKIAAKPMAPSTAANLENLWGDESPAKKTPPVSSSAGGFADIFAETKPNKPAPVEIIPAKEEDIFGGKDNFLVASKSTTDFFTF